MFHNLALIVRRPDVDRREFRDHYEDVHAPLALPYMSGLRAYQRNHVRRPLDGVEPAFDVLSQFTYESVESAAKMLDVMKTEVGERIRADEATFMDQPRNVFFAIGDPEVVADAPCTPGGFVKVAAATKDLVGDFATGVAPLLAPERGVLRCELHEVLGGPHGKPYDAVAFVWYEGDRYDPAALARWKPECEASFLLEVEECVTPISD